MSWNVLITARVFNQVGAAALQRLRDVGCNVIIPQPFGPFKIADLLPKLTEIDASLCSPDQFNSEALRSPHSARLKLISRWGVGYDSIDIAEATRQGIVVAYTPGMLNEAVADWTWALLLAIARRVPHGAASVKNGEWPIHWGHDISGKTLGIIGCGRIGQAVAKRAAGFDMKVLGHEPVETHRSPAIEYVSLDDLLQRSDFVSIHAALTPQSRGLIGEAQLRRMKPTAYLVNTARGPLNDEAALARALHKGWIAGAALDVFQTEPLPSDNPLRTAPNILLTPHQASFARETCERVSMAAAEAIVESMQGRKARWVVNPEVYEQPNLRIQLKI